MKNNFAQTGILKFYSRFLIAFKEKRKLVSFVRFLLYFLRQLKLPIYKKYYDILNFRSYFLVLERIFEQKKGSIYFEWGPGLNTELAKKYMGKVYTVEHDPKWYEYYKTTYTNLIFSPIEKNSCLNYPSEINKISGKIDIAFVDGRCRTECVKACAKAGVELCIMHDSLNPFTYKPANDTAPPLGYDNIYFYEGYSSYRYYIEIFDLRTILLTNSEKDFRQFKKLFSKFYLRSGLAQEYPI